MTALRSTSTISTMAALAWLLLMLTCLATTFNVLSSNKAAIETRITALLPQTHQSELLDKSLALLDERVQQSVLLLVSGKTPAEPASEPPGEPFSESVTVLANDLQSSLQSIAGVVFTKADAFSELKQQLLPFRNYLLTPQIRELTQEQWQQRALQGLFTPGMQSDFANDPFALLDNWMLSSLDTAVTLQNGVPVIETETDSWALLSGQLPASPFDLLQQTRIVEALQDFSTRHPEARVLRSGVVFHATAATEQARFEVSTIGLGSLLGVLLIGYLIFRRLQLLLSLLLPVACGLLFALSASLWIYGSINLLTLTFGASLVGLSVDYALHLQCFRLLHPERSLRLIWPALLLALVSSLAAYLAQLATPLPGLRQMATFTSLGLIGAWLTVCLWLPRLPVKPHPFTARAATALSCISVPDGRRWPWVVLIMLMMSSVLTIALRLHSDDDLRQINPASDSLMAEQQQVQALFSSPGSNRFLLVSAADEEQLLQRLEELQQPLSALQQQAHLEAFESLARWVPSEKQQRHNGAIIEQAYARALPEALQQAGLSDDRLTEQVYGEVLTPAHWLEIADEHPSTALWIESDGEREHSNNSNSNSNGERDSRQGPAALVLLGEMDSQGLAAVQLLAEASDIRYIDRVDTISSALTTLRQQIAIWMLIAIAILSVVLGLRYRKNVWRALLPSIGAIVLTLALISAAGTAITLFHLLGLLLVIGIGLDAGIFSAEHQYSQGAWLASSLSCATSLLAFGLLALSSTPALSILGTTCLFGLIFTWLLVPFARARNTPSLSTLLRFGLS